MIFFCSIDDAWFDMSFHDKNVYIVFDTIHEVIQMLQLRMRKESNSKELEKQVRW